MGREAGEVHPLFQENGQVPSEQASYCFFFPLEIMHVFFKSIFYLTL